MKTEEIKISDKWSLTADQYCYHLLKYGKNEKENSTNYGEMVVKDVTYHGSLKQVMRKLVEEEAKDNLDNHTKFIDRMDEIENKFSNFVDAYNLKFEPK